MYVLVACLLLSFWSMTANAQSVVATSYQAPNVPENVIDGNVNTRWSAAGDIQNKVPATLTYDIGQAETKNLVSIAWQDSVKRENYFELYVSADNVEWVWVEISTRSIATRNAVVWETYAFPSMTVRYVRVDGYGNSSNYGQWVSIREIETGYDEEVLTLDDVFVSSTGWDGINVPWNVVDNDYTSRWSNFNEPSIQFDLWEEVTVRGISIAWHEGNTRIYRFDIQMADEDQNWFHVYSGESTGNTTELETYEFTVPMEGRYLRLIGHGNSSKCVKCARWTSITEMRVDQLSGGISALGSTR